MKRQIKLRLTGRQHAVLNNHLNTENDINATAIVFCGIAELIEDNCIKTVVCVNKIYPIPKDNNVKLTELLTHPDNEELVSLLDIAKRKKQVLLKIQNHISDIDMPSSLDLFNTISKTIGNDSFMISAVMFPDGSIVSSIIGNDSEISEISLISVAGDDIKFWISDDIVIELLPEYSIRTAQSFGKGTTALLSKLTMGIVGVSGTGSPTVEMLYRLGAGKLVLVDPDIIEEKNIGRIYNSTLKDAEERRFKVHVLADAIKDSGLPTDVIPLNSSLFNPEVVRRLAQCDVLFGCVDSIDGRDLLNRIAAYYSIPYFDLGVGLEADGNGGINRVCGTVHYLQPDGSSLFSRGVYTQQSLFSSNMYRTNPEEYKSQMKTGYIKGINEDRPAVISVNTITSSLAVNDFLARIHPYRDDPNSDFSTLRISLSQSRLVSEKEGNTCSIFSKFTGKGDTIPLLDMPVLSEKE